MKQDKRAENDIDIKEMSIPDEAREKLRGIVESKDKVNIDKDGRPYVIMPTVTIDGKPLKLNIGD